MTIPTDIFSGRIESADVGLDVSSRLKDLLQAHIWRYWPYWKARLSRRRRGMTRNIFVFSWRRTSSRSQMSNWREWPRI